MSKSLIDSDENFAKQNLASAFALRVYFVGIYDELRRTIAYMFSLRGAPTPVRTGNLRLRRAALYPIELWAHCINIILRRNIIGKKEFEATLQSDIVNL